MVLGRALAIAAVTLAACSAVDSDGSGSNHAPVVHPASVTFREDLHGDLTINAEDADGDELVLTLYSSWGGTYELQKITQTIVDGTNRLEAEIDVRGYPNFYGEGEFTAWISDGVERTSGTIQVTIEPANDKPTARSDAFATAPDTELVIADSTLLANDDDAADVLDDKAPQNLGLVIESAGPASHGTVSYVDGNVRFVPEPGFAGSAPFTYTITDGEASVAATVRVLVGGINATPIVVEDNSETMEGTPVEIEISDLLANDIDDDGHTLVVIGVGNPEHGTVQLVDRVITFQPKGENGGTFFGTAGFEYTVSDGAATATGHVVVEVAPWL